MSNAVILTTSALSRFESPHSAVEPLQTEHEPDENAPLWSELKNAACCQEPAPATHTEAAPSELGGTILQEAHVGSQLTTKQQDDAWRDL